MITSRKARGARTVASQKRTEFPYGHGVFVQRLVLLLALVAFALVVLGLQLSAPPAWVAGFGVLFGVLVVVWGVSPLLTNHWLTKTRLILRQGWYFRGVFPLREIESLTKFDGDAPLGLRAHVRRRRLFVTGSKVGLLTLKLRTPRRFWAVLGAEVDEVVFDVDSQMTFLETYGGRVSSLAPVEAKRADTYLRD